MSTSIEQADEGPPTRILSDADVRAFIERGYVRLEGAFTREEAAAARNVLWRLSGCDPNDRSTWTKPVVRIGECVDLPLVKAANGPRLSAALNQIVGARRWHRRVSLGTFPIRFPSNQDPGDAGWHVDPSFPGRDQQDFLTYRVNVESKGRALLMLFLFSDVGEEDAPTRIRVGSHRHVARLLAPHGEAGLPFMELCQQLESTEACPVELAVGPAGTVFLCHPFLVHAAQPHRGEGPRFLGQPPLFPSEPLSLERDDKDYSPVEQAIREALSAA
jgi:hypothetical protein